MKIHINYNSSWTNSFYNSKNKISFNKLDRDRNIEEKIESFNNLNEKVEALKTQKKYPNYKLSDISHNTVFGILSRITGDVRRISDINNGIIKAVENKTSFINNPCYSEELVFLRNSTDNDSKDGNRICGFDITPEHNIFDNNIDFNLMFGFFNKEYNEFNKIIDNINQDLKSYIKHAENDNYVFNLNLSSKKIGLYSEVQKIENKYTKMKKDSKELLIEQWSFCWEKLALIAEKDEVLKLKYSNINFELKNSRNYELSSKFFLSRCIYKLLDFDYFIKGMFFFTDGVDISGKTDLESKNLMLNSGLTTMMSKRTLFTSKNTVPIKGGPYLMNDKFHNFSLIKKDGDLVITINANKEEEKEIYSLIYCASVNSFHVGKKGLAYVEKIELDHNDKFDIEEELK